MVSFMRLKLRRKVDLPQPDGPMKAITSCSISSRLMPLMAWCSAYNTRTFCACILAQGACSPAGWVFCVVFTALAPFVFHALASIDGNPIQSDHQAQHQDDGRRRA